MVALVISTFQCQATNLYDYLSASNLAWPIFQRCLTKAGEGRILNSGNNTAVVINGDLV